MSELRVSLIQTNVARGAPAENIASARRALDSLALSGEGPDLLLLPEFWTDPFTEESVPEEMAEWSKRALDEVCEACAEMGVFALAGSLPWRVDEGIAVRCWLVDDRGLRAGYYDKTHLFSSSGESEAFAAGSAPLFFSLNGFKCSVMTCYDIRFPEFGRSLGLCGTDVLFVNAQWPSARMHLWDLLLRALAVHNQLYVAGCNCGEASMVVSPWGEVIAEAGSRELILSYTLRLSDVQKCRKSVSVSGDRRPDLYQLTTLV